MTWGDPVDLPGPNPVVAAIDAGHWAVTTNDQDHCSTCKVRWPCEPMLTARRALAARTAAAIHPPP